MPRVLHVNDRRPEALGGTEILMGRMLRLLGAAGWTVATFTEADLPDGRRTPIRYLHNGVACRALRRKLDSFRPSVVHLHNYYHLLSPGILTELAAYRQRTNARIVMTAHDYHLVCPNSGANWFRHGPRLADMNRLTSWRYLISRRWDQRSLAHSLLKLSQHVWHYRARHRAGVLDLVLCTSRSLQALLNRAGIPTIHVQNPNPAVSSHAVERPGGLTLVFAGRIEPNKGLASFLSCLPADFHGHLVVIGEGGDRPNCEEIRRERGLTSRVSFLGRRSHEETIAQLAAAHVAVVPSLSLETYPLVAQEALAVGTNVLVSDHGGMRELVLDAGIGFRFLPNDAQSLTNQVREIEDAHATGTLNAFDAQPFLATRTEDAFLEGLQRAYRP
jgi:glycosyltransferase involved in cell wall biosynthesis